MKKKKIMIVGSIRMIYTGTTAPTEATSVIMTGTVTQVGTSAFNLNSDDGIYIGWKYTANNGHGRDNSSTIRIYLVGDNGVGGWYASSGLTTYVNYLDNGKFCNDRTTDITATTSDYPGTSGYGTTRTLYLPLIRQLRNISTYGCASNNDIFTEKVGLITYDEIVLAGGIYSTDNSYYYLYNNQRYLTMSPYNSTDTARVYMMEDAGKPAQINLPYTAGVRPVINLKVGTIFKNGTDGTWQYPYTVVGTPD